MKPSVCQVAAARWPEDAEQARLLLTHYGGHLSTSLVPATGFCLSGFQTEIDALPGKYVSDSADLLLAHVNDAAAGCVAIARHTLPDDTNAAEMKRLWVEPAFRGTGVGRGLVLGAIHWARDRGYAAVVLDTVFEAMPEAAGLYLSLGFEEVARFNDNPIAGVRFFRLTLS